MDHSIAAITAVVLARVAWQEVIDLTFDRPRIAIALWRSALQEEAILRERIVALGRRDARGRVAYLLCELYWRHRLVGLVARSMCHPAVDTERIGRRARLDAGACQPRPAGVPADQITQSGTALIGSARSREAAADSRDQGGLLASRRRVRHRRRLS